MIARFILSALLILISVAAVTKAANAAEATDRGEADRATAASLICQAVSTGAAIAWVWS